MMLFFFRELRSSELKHWGEYQPQACARQDSVAVTGKRCKWGILQEQGWCCFTKTICPALGHEDAT